MNLISQRQIITLITGLAEFWLGIYFSIFGFRESEMTIKQLQQL